MGEGEWSGFEEGLRGLVKEQPTPFNRDIFKEFLITGHSTPLGCGTDSSVGGGGRVQRLNSRTLHHLGRNYGTIVSC